MLIKILKYFSNKIIKVVFNKALKSFVKFDKFINNNPNLTITQAIKYIFHYILFIGKYLRIFSFYRIWRIIINSVLLTNISISLFIMYSWVAEQP